MNNWRHTAVILVAILLTSLIMGGQAAAREVKMLEKYNVGGYIAVGPTTPYEFQPHDDPRPLPTADTSLRTRRWNGRAIRDAQGYMTEYPATTGLMLIDQGKIVFEAYQGMGDKSREFYSMSIAKSMTSLAVGQALCNGKLTGLETLAGAVVPELNINNHGKSTIRQLLTMSSGAYMNHFAGQPKFRGGLGKRPRTGKPYQGAAWPLRLGQVSLSDLLWGFAWDKTEQKNHALPGRAFVYKAGDTMSLSKIVERATGMSLAAYFDRAVWQKVRGAHKGHWEMDKDGSTVSMSGFQVRLADWGRIAIWILESTKKPGCFGDYLRTATVTQIANSRLGTGAGGGFDGYGYQWWTDHRTVPGFWGKGYAGQDLGINPETGKILIKFGYRQYPGVTSALNRLYKIWNKPWQ